MPALANQNIQACVNFKFTLYDLADLCGCAELWEYCVAPLKPTVAHSVGHSSLDNKAIVWIRASMVNKTKQQCEQRKNRL